MPQKIIWLFLALCLTFVGETRAAWPGVEFAEVRAYAWPDSLRPDRVVSDKFELLPGTIRPAGRKLTRAQVRRVLTGLERRNPSDVYVVSGCYTPRNAFMFYNRKGQPVACLEICFDCGGSTLIPERAKNETYLLDYAAWTRVFHELGLPFGSYPNLKQALERQRERDRR